MLSVKDLEQFCLMLENKKEPNLIKLRVLKSLNNWEPIKSHIVASKIGKCLYKLTNLSDEIGTKSRFIVNKWKDVLIDNLDNNIKNVEASNNYGKSIGQPTNDLILRTNCNNKRENKNKILDVQPKKKCLSLKDYYKRNPEIGPKNIIEDNSKIISQNELNSYSGISFLDSITVKPIHKIKHNNIISRSELALSVSNRLAHSIDKISKPVAQNEIEIDDPYMKIQCQPKLYHTSKRQVEEVTHFSEKYFDKSIKNPPSLLQQCQNVLFIYKECIEEVLWTPRELLLRILKEYNADQLLKFETFNPSFIEDNDDLWKIHYTKKHKSEIKESFPGCWRDRYLQLDSYLEIKMEKSLNSLKSKIDDIEREIQKKKPKVLPAPRKNPTSGRFFCRKGEDSTCSPATQKLRRLYKTVFNHLR